MNPINCPLKKLSAPLLTLCAIFGGLVPGHAQVTVKVDSTKNWSGYMNWYSTSDIYVGGGVWGVADLRAKFVPDKANATRVILQVNTNTYNPADVFWNNPDGTPNKRLEANFYVDVGTSYGGQDVTFVGNVESNTIPVGWTCEAVIKEFAPGYAFLGITRTPIVGGTPFSVNRIIGAGNITQYGFLTYGPNAAPGSPATLEAASLFVDNSDPAITSAPVNQRVVVGGSASFSVTAVGGSPLSYQWQRYTTNILNAVGKFSGATSPTLTIANAEFADATTYSVIVTDAAGSVTNTAVLRVLTPAEFANCLDNPSFELDYITFGIVPAPWINFSGSALLSGTDFIYDSPVQGTNVVQVYNAGQYNGIYQDVPAAPGDIFTGSCYLFQSSLDPLSSPINEAYLEIQFRQGDAPQPIAVYNSIFITNDLSLQNQWLFLPATNGVAAGFPTTSTMNATYLVAPAGTDRVRYQITQRSEGGGSGSVFVDVMSLMKKIPVTVTATVSDGSITLSWLTQGATSYEVVYKDNLSGASWTSFDPAAVVVGDGTVKSKSFPTTGSQRFYSVLTK